MKHRLEIPLVWAATALLSTLGCSSAGDGDLGTTVDGDTEQEAATFTDVHALGDEAMQSIALQVPGRDFRTAPPKISSVYLFPAGSDSADGRVLLEAKIDEELPRVLKFIWKDQVTLLRDDGKGGDRAAGDNVYSAKIDADVERLARRATALEPAAGDAVALSAQARGGIAVPVHGKHILAANLDGGEASAVARAEASDHLYVDPERSLLIRDLSVVNDSNRTQDPCRSTTSADANLKWTFGYLIRQMADNPATASVEKTPSQFALDWLNRWSSFSSSVNGQSLAQQPQLSTRDTPATIKAKWLKASKSTTTLAMNKAPFRLLAIVNRLDLRHNLLFGEGPAGELRFVFAVLDNDVREPNVNPQETRPQPCALLDISENTGPTLGARPSHTVILEYAVDKGSPQEVFDWAQSWQHLSELEMGSPEYLSNLEGLTESVVTAGKGGGSRGRANGSELIRIRTNQSLNNTMWELREFQINNTVGSSYRYSPVPVTVKQTPQGITSTATNNRNETWNLGKWIYTNGSAIESESHKVPDVLPSGQGYQSPLSAFLGAAAVTSGQNAAGGTDAAPWGFLGCWVPSGGWLNYDDPRDVQIRHLFSKNTCNGCHGSETRPQGLSNNQAVFHVAPRTYSEKSKLSNFLTGLPMGEDPPSENYVYVPDPIEPSTQRYFNDLSLRAEDMRTLLFFGPLSALTLQPSTRTH